MEPVTHRMAEERSLALHREVARRLEERPELLEVARARVEGWLRDGSVAATWVRRWRELLSRPLDEVIAVITDEGEKARDLRQSSPFAGVVDPRTRWRILREVRSRGPDR